LAVTNELESHFLNNTQWLHILNAFAHRIAATAEITFVEDIKQ
jgi:hypothetical protein